MSIEIILADGPDDLAGAAFETDAFSWPPPEEIQVVTSEAGKNGPELLDLPEDKPRPGEHLHVYRRSHHGHFCGSRRCWLVASYSWLRSAPVPQPSLFEGLGVGG